MRSILLAILLLVAISVSAEEVTLGDGESAIMNWGAEEPQTTGTETTDIGAPAPVAEAGYVKIGDIQGESGDESKGTELDDIGAPAPEAASGYMKMDNIKGESGDETKGTDLTDIGAPAPETKAGYVKIGDIKGEVDESADGDPDRPIVVGNAAAKKPKEIVVVGSKAREEPVPVDGHKDEIDVLAWSWAHDDENVEEIKISEEEEVSVVYKKEAKLFGFIRASYNFEAQVDKQGRVKVKYPWWLALASDNAAETEEALEEAATEGTQTNNMISNMQKAMHDTSMAIIRKMG